MTGEILLDDNYWTSKADIFFFNLGILITFKKNVFILGRVSGGGGAW